MGYMKLFKYNIRQINQKGGSTQVSRPIYANNKKISDEFDRSYYKCSPSNESLWKESLGDHYTGSIENGEIILSNDLRDPNKKYKIYKCTDVSHLENILSKTPYF